MGRGRVMGRGTYDNIGRQVSVKVKVKELGH